jgi:putative DNA primase/helicase
MGKVNGAWPEAGGQDLTDWFARHRKTKEELFELLIEATEIECSRNKLESVERFFPLGTFKPALLAKEIMEEWELASDPLAGLLYRWNGKFWEEFDPMFIRQKALRILGTEGDSSRVSNVTTQVIDLSLLPFGTEMNKAHEFMCVENGMLNIYENMLYPHEKDYFCSCMINTHYDPSARCDRWEKFLSETVQDPDTIKVLQEFAGYILTPDVSHEKALLLYGKGSDGKSTFVNVLKSLVGEHACGAVSLENLEDQYYRATLHNKFLNICTETEGSIFYSGMFKAIVSGDTISAAHKNKKPFDFAPTIKMIYAFNRWPKVMDNTDAFYRRLLTVRFKRQFKGKDKTLGLDKILLKELPGILNWALEGLARLRKQKSFTDSADINNTLISYMFENNPVMGFVYDMCRTEPEYSGEEEHMYTRQDVLYPKYRSFCSKCGFHPLNLNSFSRELRIICPKIEIKRIGSREGRYKVFTNIVYVGADNE